MMWLLTCGFPIWAGLNYKDILTPLKILTFVSMTFVLWEMLTFVSMTLGLFSVYLADKGLAFYYKYLFVNKIHIYDGIISLKYLGK